MKPALLLVDVQADYLATSDLQPPSVALVAQSATLLAGCRERQIPVIHIWTTIRRDDDHRLPHWRLNHQWYCVEGTPGHAPPKALNPRPGESIVHKSGWNAFPLLDTALQRLDLDTVILAGLHLHTCVRIAAMECLERGYRVYIAEDAVGSNDPIHAASTRRWLAERCVEFKPVPAILNSCDAAPEHMVHRSPRCTEKVLFEIHPPDTTAIAAETEVARAAQKNWRETSLASRCELLEKFATNLDAAAPALARQMAIELGKPISHGAEEVRRGTQNIRVVIRHARHFEFTERESGGIVRHQPLGVVALISPWNNPVAIPIGKIAPALAYGNTVVWKPAPAATQIAQALLKLLQETGIEPETVRLLPGDHSTGQQLASDLNIDAVTLTGSLNAGYAIEEICARRMIPLQAELNGNNAAIVWDDADLEDAAKQLAWGAFGFAGQRCTASRRIIVHTDLFGSFLKELKAAGEALPWGDPLEPATQIGPVINIRKRDEQAALLDSARGDSAVAAVYVLQEVRSEEAWAKTGAYVPPAIICCDKSSHALVQEETMSPLVILQRAENFEHALDLANGTRYGLAAALFSNNRDLQEQFLAETRAGILKINSSTAGADISLPFGGWKASGLGPPEHGAGDRLFYTRMQAVYGLDR